MKLELFGDGVDGERKTDSEGLFVKHILPRSDRLLNNIDTLRGTTDDGEGLLKRLHRR